MNGLMLTLYGVSSFENSSNRTLVLLHEHSTITLPCILRKQMWTTIILIFRRPRGRVVIWQGTLFPSFTLVLIIS